MTNPLPLSTVARPLVSMAQAVWPYIRRMHRERHRSDAICVGNDLLEQGIDATFDRLCGGSIDDTWWHNLLSHIGHQLVAPDFLRMPALRSGSLPSRSRAISRHSRVSALWAATRMTRKSGHGSGEFMQLSLQRHFNALTKFVHVESRFCGRKQHEKAIVTCP